MTLANYSGETNRRGGSRQRPLALAPKDQKSGRLLSNVTCEPPQNVGGLFLPPSTNHKRPSRSKVNLPAGSGQKEEVYLKHGAADSTSGGPLLLTACADDEDNEAEDRGIMGKRQLPLHPS